MVDLAALSFIGLGVQPPQTEWGLLMAQSRTALLDGQPLGTFVPGALIVLVVITVNLIGSTYVKDSHR
jgi:peptide/nickel transport system permease protein